MSKKDGMPKKGRSIAEASKESGNKRGGEEEMVLERRECS